ncbi:geranylgeranylglycerol-phosphate geranylgeranyltransferase [Lutibacter sp.]|uniref:geranylgeranylglycerol-phosphate geranylgeranyltransferase n=1 Tax=Lutibacter sp. TaxID=1925666 RepID=UPI0035676A90
MKLVAFFKLIRWKNLLLILYVQLLLKFLVFNSFNIVTNLSLAQFVILLISILLITAAGYVINDILDIKTDLINKPRKVIVTKNFSIEKAQWLYLVLNATGIILGIGLALNIERPSYSFIFIGASLLLYYYSKKFKSKPLIGNLIVSFLTAFSIYILYLFDINKTIQTTNQQLITNVLIVLSIFAFLLNFIREIVKDIEDVNGDYSLKINTLPILIGKKRTSKIASILCLLPLSLSVYIVIRFASIYKFTSLYLVVFTIIPLLYIALKLVAAKSIKDYKKLSTILKISMFLGINALIIFSLNT